MDWQLFLTVLAITESLNSQAAIGDQHLQDKAYGVYQIRQIYLNDVNWIAGTDFTMDDVRRNPAIATWCVITYVKYWGKIYERQMQKPLTMEVACRIHNGGPSGWRKSATDAHWERFRQFLTEETGQ